MRRRPRVRLEAIQSGGGQERGMRSGTVPAPLAVGLGEACRIAMADMKVRHLSNKISLCSINIKSIFCVCLGSFHVSAVLLFQTRSESVSDLKRAPGNLY